jgi:hypothetical protein
MPKTKFLISAAKPLIDSPVVYPELVYLTRVSRYLMGEMIGLYKMAEALSTKNESFVEIRNHVPNCDDLIVLPVDWLQLAHPQIAEMFEAEGYDPNTGQIIELSADEVEEAERLSLIVTVNQYACNSHVTWEFAITGEEPSRVHTLTLTELCAVMAISDY